MQFSVNEIPLNDGMMIEVEGSSRDRSVSSHAISNVGPLVLSSSKVNTADRAARRASARTDGSADRTATTSMVASRYGSSGSIAGPVTNGGENMVRQGNFSRRS